ncbi:LacI family transcriptional regulator/LacI family purine nucleotide synthesis repressor [Paenibacillus phyllosphaerae]|uniref:LacI family transcriptional regulator/LacI family purine nucleotide synthesis repressor n=1 Tax=Paenibacillus phyllosphaerae TaxID=274593 RepID=A0A7W5AWV4_9BACL|nr:LacI family DNA-binding transcriptional regulator [Paenibacillus phyllosphaerae]MBB3110284.1 LacI family transcriptional regulator/LacI family purine nucleotide synthesis repressor [Paenibacillus phyllosphaerae]
MKPITVYDIAKEANVSVATVSRVLNNTAPVKKATRDRITELINKYQFQPNALARSLTKKETGMIGIILPDITNPFFPEILAGFDKAARSKGYTYFLCDTVSSNEDNTDQYARESQYLSLLMEKQVDGIVMIGGRIDLAKPGQELTNEVMELGKRVPIVLVNGNLPGAGLTRVAADEKLGAELATQHLIDQGHKEIAIIGGFKHMSNTIARTQGFTRTMEKNGLPIRKEWMINGGFSVRKGFRFMEELLQGKVRPTAVVCVNDLIAFGALKAATKAGLRVPDDLSLVGYDDIPFASYTSPELTTISLKAEELGSQAADILHKLITKNKVPKLTKIVPELRIRESTAPPASLSAN